MKDDPRYEAMSEIIERFQSVSSVPDEVWQRFNLLTNRLRKIADAEGGEQFLNWPDRWYSPLDDDKRSYTGTRRHQQEPGGRP